MNIPEMKSYEEKAIDTVVTVLNKARFSLGERQNLFQLAKSRDIFNAGVKVSVAHVGPPLAKTTEKFIADTIERKWNLTPTLMYHLKYMGNSQNECSQFFYYEVYLYLQAIFSQPLASYPIPQVVASVFFRIEDKYIEPPETRGVPMMIFRIEGHHTDHDIRFVALTLDWILAVMKKKSRLFQMIENMRIF